MLVKVFDRFLKFLIMSQVLYFFSPMKEIVREKCVYFSRALSVSPVTDLPATPFAVAAKMTSVPV